MLNGYFKTYGSANEAWVDLHNTLKAQNDNIAVRGRIMTGEILNCVSVITNPRDNIVHTPERGLSMKYAVGELLWYLSGSNQLKDVVPYSKFWKDMSDDGKTINSAYGHRIQYRFGFNQMDFVRDTLYHDPGSRQAVIHIKDASNKPTKDTPCTIALQYQIRDDKLHATTMMRSNDIWLGWPYDVFCFTSFQIMLAMELGVDVGTYTHIANNLHKYGDGDAE